MLFIYLQNMIYSQVIFFCNKQNDCRIGMYCNTLSECDYCDNISPTSCVCSIGAYPDCIFPPNLPSSIS